MSTLNTPGIVVRTVNYRDHDRILTILTPQQGCLDVLSRGCRRPKSPLMPPSELFVSGNFCLYRGAERSTLTSCELADTFYPLRLEPYRLTCASYLAALCAAGAPPGEEAADLYALLLEGLYYLAYDGDCDPLGTVTAFLLLYADALGYRPRLSRCTHCRAELDLTGDAFLDIPGGGLCCPDCVSRSAFRLTHDQVVWMSQTLRNGLTPQKNSAAALFEPLRRYAETRLDTVIKVSRLLP